MRIVYHSESTLAFRRMIKGERKTICIARQLHAYTIDVTMKKEKTLELGRHLGIIVAEDSKIPKMPVINPLQALVHPQTQKTTLNGLSIPNANFSKFTFLVYRSAA